MSAIPKGEFLLPLFPLPNLVFFAGTRLPLHVFEPRYRSMIKDALVADERFGLVLLRPGWESDYQGAPPLHEYGTIAHIEQAVVLEEGKYNVLVRGIVRFRILELVAETPYRIARVVAAPETPPEPMEAWAQRSWLVELAQRYLELLPGGMAVPEMTAAPLDALTSALVMALDLDFNVKQQLLEMNALTERAEKVGQLLTTKLEAMDFLAPFRRDNDPNIN